MFEGALIPARRPGCDHSHRPRIDELSRKLDGLKAVVVGRSNIVGKPMAQLLLARNCTVTLAHSRTRDLAEVARAPTSSSRRSAGPQMVRGDWVKPGAIVIDVGINRIAAPEKGEGKTRLVGDVAYSEAAEVARRDHPGAGGVGQMTIAMLIGQHADRRRPHPGPSLRRSSRAVGADFRRIADPQPAWVAVDDGFLARDCRIRLSGAAK